MTCSRGGAVAVLVAHVVSAGAGRAARRAGRRWAECDPVLARFGCPAEVAAACRAARPSDQDRLLAALLAVAAGDEWAQLTVLAGLGDRLGWVVEDWVRSGMPAGEVADCQAELVAACWAAIASWAGRPPPSRPGLALVDAAWEQVRALRRRQRRREGRACPLSVEAPADGAARPVLEVLAGAVTDAVEGRRLGLRPARAVYLTRVAGLSTGETAVLLGCGPAVVRVLRARAEHVLAA